MTDADRAALKALVEQKLEWLKPQLTRHEWDALKPVLTEYTRALIAAGLSEAPKACPHCHLPPVMPDECTPEINAVIEAETARDWELFEAGRQHEAKHRLVKSAGLSEAPAHHRFDQVLQISALVNAYHNDGTTLTAAETLKAIADVLGPAMGMSVESLSEAPAPQEKAHYNKGKYDCNRGGYDCVCGGFWRVFLGGHTLHVDPASPAPPKEPSNDPHR